MWANFGGGLRRFISTKTKNNDNYDNYDNYADYDNYDDYDDYYDYDDSAGCDSATVVRQLAKITVAVNEYGALRGVCDSLFSATVHLQTINYNDINDLENLRQCDSCPYI